MKPLQGKIAIVTGSAQGIGRASAERLARDGACVVLADRAEDECNKVRTVIEGEGGQAMVVGVDLQTKAGVDEMVARTLEAYGAIDIAVHNVGGTLWVKPFWEYTDEEIQQEIGRSLWPTLRCCRAIIPVMIAQQRGAIVNIGSIIATRGLYRVPYSAAKGGVHAMTVTMAQELGRHKVRVNCVAPGAVEAVERPVPRNTAPLTDAEIAWRKEINQNTLGAAPLARRGTIDEIANAVAFFASDQSSFITGEVMYVAGGNIGSSY